MNKQPSHERRRHKRHAYSTEFRGTRLSATGVTDASWKIFCGQIQDSCVGGLSLIANGDLDQFGVIRGEVMLPDIPIGVPTLLPVRWVKRETETCQYRIGLQFLV